MYSNKSLYYLNRMGIQPWVRKVSPEETHQKLKLILLAPSILDEKSQSLLNKMIAYIQLNEDEVLFINTQESDAVTWQDRLIKTSAVAVLSWLNDIPEGITMPCPVVHSISPIDLLKQPIRKREVLNHLNQIKNWIGCSDENQRIFSA